MVSFVSPSLPHFMMMMMIFFACSQSFGLGPEKAKKGESLVGKKGSRKLHSPLPAFRTVLCSWLLLDPGVQLPSRSFSPGATPQGEEPPPRSGVGALPPPFPRFRYHLPFANRASDEIRFWVPAVLDSPAGFFSLPSLFENMERILPREKRRRVKVTKV